MPGRRLRTGGYAGRGVEGVNLSDGILRLSEFMEERFEGPRLRAGV